MNYTFPADAQYDIQVRLMRNRNENVEGLNEPHDIEVTLDGQRLEALYGCTATIRDWRRRLLRG
jgi:hypothetical protein